MNWDLQMS
jgi:DNA replication licensing factor MCM6